jgi:hypothetical protein
MNASFDRSHAITAGIVVLALLLLVMVLRDLGGELPALPRFVPSTAVGTLSPTDHRLGQLFAPAALMAVSPATNLPPPFTTTYFQPPPPPPKADVKKTRKVALTYNGYFETAAGEKRAYLMVGGAMAMLPVGAPVISDLMLSNIQRAQLTLRRAVTQEVVVPFRGTTEIEVPAE